MIDNNYFTKLIDFGEAKIVDNYDDAISMNSKRSLSSDGQSSFFGRLLKKDDTSIKRVQRHKGTFVGTASYCAPEMLNNNQSGLYTDLWAFGTILFELSCGRKMFYGKNNMEVFNKITDREIHWPKEMDPDLKELIQKLTQQEPTKRIGLKNVG